MQSWPGKLGRKARLAVQVGRAGKPGRHCKTCSPVRK